MMVNNFIPSPQNLNYRNVSFRRARKKPPTIIKAQMMKLKSFILAVSGSMRFYEVRNDISG